MIPTIYIGLLILLVVGFIALWAHPNGSVVFNVVVFLVLAAILVVEGDLLSR